MSAIEVQSVEFTRDEVDNAVQVIDNALRSPDGNTDHERRTLPEGGVLAKFLLLRWDQLHELASAIKRRQAGQGSIVLSPKLFEDALADIPIRL